MQNSQKGFLSYTQIFSLFALGVLILFIVKLMPVYSENVYVTDALKALSVNNRDLNALDKNQIETQISKYMTVNSVAPDPATSISVKRMGDKYIVSSVYETRVPIIHNIDVVVSFKSQLDTSKPDECCKYLVDVTKNDK